MSETSAPVAQPAVDGDQTAVSQLNPGDLMTLDKDVADRTDLPWVL